MINKIFSLPKNLKMPLGHLEFEKIDVDIHCRAEEHDLIHDIGGVFLKGLAEGRYEKRAGVFGLTPNHGRVAVTPGPKKTAILIKGIGWTLGGPTVLLSTKDDELCFGLYDKESALREISVSQQLESMGVPATRVLGYGQIKNSFLTDAKYSSGKPINPCLLYTQTISALRVSDLMFFNLDQRVDIISQIAEILGVSSEHFFEWFCLRLGEVLGILHDNGGCNDTLDWGNVTLAAEITDFEWGFVPGVPLPWGDGFKRLPERREKELIYAFEICMRLCHMLGLSNKTIAQKITASLQRGYSVFSDQKLGIFEKLQRSCVLAI